MSRKSSSVELYCTVRKLKPSPSSMREKSQFGAQLLTSSCWLASHLKLALARMTAPRWYSVNSSSSLPTADLRISSIRKRERPLTGSLPLVRVMPNVGNWVFVRINMEKFLTPIIWLSASKCGSFSSGHHACMLQNW